MRQTFFHLTEDLASKHFLCADKDHKPRQARQIEHRTLREELQRVNGITRKERARITLTLRSRQLWQAMAARCNAPAVEVFDRLTIGDAIGRAWVVWHARHVLWEDYNVSGLDSYPTRLTDVWETLAKVIIAIKVGRKFMTRKLQWLQHAHLIKAAVLSPANNARHFKPASSLRAENHDGTATAPLPNVRQAVLAEL